MKLSLLSTALALASSCVSSVLAGPTSTTRHRRWNNIPSGFVYSEDGQFKIDGADFKFGGTNAYWMFLLNEDSDIFDTFAEFAGDDIKVVRVFAFREVVDHPPAFGNFTNIWVDGVAKCSEDGMTRLQVILDAAKQHDIKVVFSLTNNWSPSTPNDAHRPPGYFSNEYGGIDTYVQQINPGGHHDEFYTDDTIFAAYQDYLKCAVPRFKDHPALFSWELANDARCQGADGRTTSSSCNTATVTKWVQKTARFVKSLDPNHLVSSGDGGFFCTQSTCPKINTPTPPPAVSQGVGSGKKHKRSLLTSKHVLDRFRRSVKEARSLVETDSGKKIRVRGGWTAPPTSANTFAKRGGSLGAAYDGSHGVDSQDICNDPNIDYCNFQDFPDQNNYSVQGGSLSKRANSDSSSGFNANSVSDSIQFILNQADSSKRSGKPVLNSATGITSTSQSNTLNNFDSSHVGPKKGQKTASNKQQQQAYSSITAASIKAGVNGILSYQHGSTGKHSKKGSIVDDSHPAQSDSDSSSKRALSGLGRTPNDGYAIYPGSNNANIWNNANKNIGG